MGIIHTILSRPRRRMGIPLSVVGVYYPSQPLPVGHPPSASTAPDAQHKHGGNGEIVGGQVERPKVQLDDVLVLYFVLSHQSLSLSFRFDTVFVILFSQSCFLVIAFAIHALSFPFSDRCAL